MNERSELLESVRFLSKHIVQCERGDFSGGCPMLRTWIGPIEAFYAGTKKGRGVRAKKDIIAGQVLLIEPPLAMSDTDSKNECLFTIDSSIKDHAQVYLRQAIILRAQRECVLSRIVDCLSDGVNELGVTALQDLIPNLTSCKLLLPTHYDLMKEETKLELTADRVDAIVDVNSFGDGRADGNFTQIHMGCVSSRLIPATSLFNHSKHPKCFYSWIGGCTVIFAVTDVKAGEELTICYHPDENSIRTHWGIHE